MIGYRNLVSLIQECRNEHDVDRQIQILENINIKLPKSRHLKLPSIITNDYVHKALDIVEESIGERFTTLSARVPVI
jgi:hypothetical protein